jgi:DNA-binding response OmpR family regulator
MSTQAIASSCTGISRRQATPATSTGREPILVVEADADFGRALVEQLAADGHPAELSRTASHAEMTAGAHPPRLLVLGELDTRRGTLDLLETIRGHHPEASRRQTTSPWPRNLPVIVLSSRRTEPDMLRAFEAGADDFIVRPARYLELRGFISRATETAFSSKGAAFRRFEAVSEDRDQIGEAPKIGRKTWENRR